MTTERDFYDILGISRDASEDQIKDSYRNLAKKWHPDLNPENRNEAEERFKEIGEAYQVLNNSEKRQVYDTYGKSGLSGFSSNQNSVISVFVIIEKRMRICGFHWKRNWKIFYKTPQTINAIQLIFSIEKEL